MIKEIICEQCGNEFYRKPLKNAEGKYNEYVNCPYCWYKNYVSTKKKKKNKDEKREC